VLELDAPSSGAVVDGRSCSAAPACERAPRSPRVFDPPPRGGTRPPRPTPTRRRATGPAWRAPSHSTSQAFRFRLEQIPPLPGREQRLSTGRWRGLCRQAVVLLHAAKYGQCDQPAFRLWRLAQLRVRVRDRVQRLGRTSPAASVQWKNATVRQHRIVTSRRVRRPAFRPRYRCLLVLLAGPVTT
jgi:hypothetical protein